ncbi:hypothetical protein GQ43DRAFT_136832 [Delitschia confertaspora ATCC 74209]|uniref:Uncharacterized protein n=1 Tax=Delitschia confertaspora ATCC 74209 TaxID=1513339 RepID=A0A9P4JUM0_9PLEO|nr:hypothetical protein GQ43DRAFT_136832 [Delitschia confertaspora ATCC 74209]
MNSRDTNGRTGATASPLQTRIGFGVGSMYTSLVFVWRMLAQSLFLLDIFLLLVPSFPFSYTPFLVTSLFLVLCDIDVFLRFIYVHIYLVTLICTFMNIYSTPVYLQLRLHLLTNKVHFSFRYTPFWNEHVSCCQ